MIQTFILLINSYIIFFINYIKKKFSSFKYELIVNKMVQKI
jgi:hypothetical protein